MGRGFGIAGFVISLIAVVFSSLFHNFGLVFPILAIPLGILGLIFTRIQYKKGKTGLATAGLIISIIAIIFGVFDIVAAIVVVSVISSFLKR